MEITHLADYGTKLQTVDESFVRNNAIVQLQNLALHSAVTAITLEELKTRGIKLSPRLNGFLTLLRTFGAGGSEQMLGLEPGALNLHSHLKEISGEAKPEAIAPHTTDRSLSPVGQIKGEVETIQPAPPSPIYHDNVVQLFGRKK
jgi:hypothetical protein